MEQAKRWLKAAVFFIIGSICLGIKAVYRLVTGKELKMFYE